MLFFIGCFGLLSVTAQSYKSGFRTDVCACLEAESLKRPITENTLKACLRETLPKYAAQIDAQIVEPDINKKFHKGQLARKDLLVATQYELIYTCDVYFKHLDYQRTSKKLIARENARETDLEKYNQMVAMTPNAMAYFMRGQLQFNLGNIKAAEADVNKSLELNPNKENTRRQVSEACYSFVNPTKTKNPEIIHYSSEVSAMLGISEAETKSEEFLNIFTGNEIIKGSAPYAMCYGGHQFGQWAGQLGDGRAINLTEVRHNNKQWALQLKGAGATPYSRTADGLAVLRSSVREYLCSEAMFHLGVPTTRALSLSLSGDQVMRDILYNGNPAYEKGAVVCRVSPSFLRFGSYEILSARKDHKTLKTLVDYTLKHFYPNSLI